MREAPGVTGPGDGDHLPAIGRRNRRVVKMLTAIAPAADASALR